MAFNISYNFIAVDKFTSVAKKVAKTVNGIDSSAKKATKSTEKFSKTVNSKAVKSVQKLGVASVKTAAAIKKIGGPAAQGAMKGINSSVGKASDAFNNLAKGVILAGTAMVAKGLKSAVEFETELATLSAITGATGKDLETLQNGAFGTGREFGIAAAEILKATTIVASGKSELLDYPDKLNAVTNAVTLLSAATGDDMVTSADAVIAAMNQFGLEADQANRVVNTLAAGSKVGAAVVAETAEAMVKAGVAARGAGVGFEETTAAIQVLAKAGIKGAIAGTNLKGALLKLQTAGMRDINPEAVGLTTALENLAKMNLTAEQSAKLFGESAFNVGNVLIRDRALLKDWTDRVTGTSVASEQAAKTQATFAKRVQALGVTIDNFITKAFLKMEPQITMAIEKTQAWFDTLTDKDVETFATNLQAVADVLTTIVELIGTAASGMKTLGEALGWAGAMIVTAPSEGRVRNRKNDYDRVVDEQNEAAKKIGGFRGNPSTGQVSGEVKIDIGDPSGAVRAIESKSKGDVSLKVGSNSVAAAG